MKLVEQNRRDTFEIRIIKDHACENALGDDEDFSLGRNLAFKAHTIADRFARFFAQELRHASCRSARRKTARFEQHNHPITAPTCIQKMQRHQRCFTSTGRGNQNCGGVGSQRGIELRQNALNGKIGQTRQMKFRIIKALLWCLSHKERR